MKINRRRTFRSDDVFISFDLKIENQKGKVLIRRIVTSIKQDHDLRLTRPQEKALELILLNAIHFNYRPLIISLNNNTYRATSRYNASGVGMTTFRTVYRILDRKDLIYTRYKAVAGLASTERTVIEALGLKQYCSDYAEKIKSYLRIKTELIELRKTNKKYYWNNNTLRSRRFSTSCEYKDNDYSHSVRRFLKDYNRWIASASIAFDLRKAEETGLFNKPKYRDYRRDELLAYVMPYFQNTSLKRIYVAPESYHPNSQGKLPKLGGRFYGSFWQDQIPSDFRKYLLVDDKPCIELDFRAMNATMLYMAKTGKPWASYPYENIPVPNSNEVFPKAVVKPFFTWCLNVGTRKEAESLLRNQLSKELAKNEDTQEYEHFIKEHDLTYSEYVDAMLDSQPAIKEAFFSDYLLGCELQFHDSEIVMEIMKQCMNIGIYCFPIHDALLVQQQHKTIAKEIMVRTLCEYFKVSYKTKYQDLLIKEEMVS